MHNTSNEFEFRVLWSKIEKKCEQKTSMSKFLKYFKAQWMDSIFCNWRIFQTPPGFTTTNNPIESYNAIIKKFFTNRLKLNIIPALETFKNECIGPESSRKFEYATKKTITRSMENKSKKLKIENFKKIDKHLYKYKHTKGDISTINLNNETCTCNEIVDKGVCIHLIRVALLEKYNLQGMITNDKFSTRLMRRKKPASEDKNSSSSFSAN